MRDNSRWDQMSAAAASVGLKLAEDACACVDAHGEALDDVHADEHIEALRTGWDLPVRAEAAPEAGVVLRAEAQPHPEPVCGSLHAGAAQCGDSLVAARLERPRIRYDALGDARLLRAGVNEPCESAAFAGHRGGHLDLGDDLPSPDVDDPLAHPSAPRLSVLTNTGSAPISW